MARNIVPNTVCSEHLFRTLSLSPMKDHQNHPQDHQNHLQDHQNHPQDHQHHPKGGPGNPVCGSGGPGGGSGGPGGGSETVFRTDVRNRQCSEHCSEPTKLATPVNSGASSLPALVKGSTVELQTPSFGDPKGHYWTPFWQSLVWIGDHLRGLKEVIRCCSWGAVGSF